MIQASVGRLEMDLNPSGHFSEAFEKIKGQIQFFITVQVHEKMQVVTMYSCESPGSVGVLVLCHQKFVTEFRVYLAIFKPPFPIDWESACCPDKMLCNMNTSVPMVGLKPIKCL
jgi:hypothetical protein